MGEGSLAGSSFRVLVVDDDPDVRLLCRLGLTRAGHEVLEASDGEEALALLERQGADVVLLDLMLPVLDGHGFLRRMGERVRQVPVVVVTALGRAEELLRGLELGAVEYLTKPFRPAELVATVVHVAAASPAEREARRERSLARLGKGVGR